MLAQDEVTERQPSVPVSAHPEDQALALLVARAIRRGDRKLARDLAAVPPRCDETIPAVMVTDCPALKRIAAVCDPVETLAWRRAVIGAGVRSDRQRLTVLLELAARRCSG
jgi:hypothetical protein